MVYLPDAQALRMVRHLDRPRQGINRVRAIVIEQHFSSLAKNSPKGRNAPDRYSDATIHIAYRVLRAAINAAHRKGVISHNPMSQVTAPKAYKSRQNAVSVDEVRLVLSARESRPP